MGDRGQYKIKIEDYIPEGKENAITREELRQRTGLEDRALRDHIAGARRNGALIINLQDGRGYYKPTVKDYREAKHFRDQEYARARKIMRGYKNLSAWLQDVEAGRIK